MALHWFLLDCLDYILIPTQEWQHTFDILQIAQMNIPISVQKIFFRLLFVGFGVFGALFPFHTWVPDGHSSAPTAALCFLQAFP